MKKYILYPAFLLILSLTNIQADIPKLELWGFGFDFDGEVRNRFAFFNNYDMDYDTSDGKVADDLRARLALEVTSDSPFYYMLMLELGNIQFDADLKAIDFVSLELKEIYAGYDSSFIDGKLGLIDVKTAGGAVYDDDSFGIQVKADFDFLQAKSFFTMPELVDETLTFVDGLENLNYLFYLGVQQEKFIDVDLWGMFLWDNSPEDYYYYYCIWTGIELEKKMGMFSGDFGFTYNFGAATYLQIPIYAYYSHLTLEMEPTRKTKVYTRFNLSSGSDGSDDTINQFQVVNGEGNLETGLGLLFGGSSFDNQSYFSSESLSIVEDGLSSDDFVFEDPGLFIYEVGFRLEFDQIPLETEFVLGGANTGELFNGDGYFTSLIGWEFDIHNTIKFSKDLKLNISTAYLIAGNSFNGCYELNTGETLELDTSFMMDCSIKYSF